MITNLLDKTVVYRDVKAKICCIYEKNQTIWLGLLTYEGKLVFGILPEEVHIDINNNYKVYLLWSPDKKIMAIKLCREVTGLGLKEAKEKVEASHRRLLLATALTYEEAQELLKNIRSQGMEGEIDG